MHENNLPRVSSVADFIAEVHTATTPNHLETDLRDEIMKKHLFDLDYRAIERGKAYVEAVISDQKSNQKNSIAPKKRSYKCSLQKLVHHLRPHSLTKKSEQIQ